MLISQQGLEAEHTQSGYGFVHFPNTPVGIESAVRAVQAFQRQTVDRVSYDCNLSHRLQAVLDAQKAKLEGYVEITDDGRGNPLPPQSPHAHQSPHLQQMQMQQQMHGQQHVPQQPHSPTPYHQQLPHHHQMYQQSQPYAPHLQQQQRYSNPGTPRMSGTTMSSGSTSARSSFTEGRSGAGGVPGRSSRDELNANLPGAGGPASPYGQMRPMPQPPQGLPPTGGSQQHGTPGVGNGGSGGPGGIQPASGGVAGGAVPYPDDRLSSSSGESFRSSSRSMEYASPSVQQQGVHTQHPHHLMYRSTSYPSPHVPYHPGTPTSGYGNYVPHAPVYHDEVYHQQAQQQQQMAQGGYMMPYGAHPPPPQQHQQQPQQGYDDGSGRVHYVDPQQAAAAAAAQGYMYPMNMSPSVMYVPDVVMSPRYVMDTTQSHLRNQQQQGHPSPYSPHGPAYVMQPMHQQHHRGGGGGGGYSNAAPYGGMSYSNIQPRYQGGGVGGGSGGFVRPGQNHPRARQANSSLRTFDASSPREYGSGAAGSTSPYGGSQGGTSVSSFSGRGYSSSHPQSPVPSSASSAPSGMYNSASSATLSSVTTSASGDAVAAEADLTGRSDNVTAVGTDVCASVEEVAEGLSAASLTSTNEEDDALNQKIGPS